MSAILMDIGAFDSELRAGKLVLTANNRQRNQLLRAFNANHSAGSWRAPRVQTLRQWQERLWLNYQLAGLPDADLTVQTTSQRDILWQEVIEQHASAEQLLQPGRLATHAEAARMALDAWNCPIDTLQQWQHEDIDLASYQSWYLAFHEKLATLRLGTAEIVQNLLIEAFSQGWIAAETDALLYGFDDLAPLSEQLIQCALPGAITVTTKPLDATPTLLAHTDSDSEILHAALWADQVLAEQPDATIGIVVPNLGQIRSRVESLLQSVFTPLEPLPTQAAMVAPYNFSAGTPLAHAPVVDSALTLATGLLKTHTLESACDFLNNPYIGDCQSEWQVRMQAIDSLRHQAKLQYSIGDIRQTIEKVCSRSELASEIQSALHIQLTNVRKWQQQKPVEYWRQELTTLLDSFAWPGNRQLTSIEHQQVAQFYEQLNELDSIARVKPICSFWDYCERLADTLRHTPFQAQTPDSPIQILGVLEAAGLQFTHLRVIGMHHNAWPPAAAPNPLLPVELQRDWGMPKSSAEHELSYATRLTERMAACATHVIFSYPATEGDRALQVSRLVEELCHTDCENSQPEPTQTALQINYQRIVESATLELVECKHGPEIVGDDLPGGTGIVKAQAACPFSAFAKYRLGAQQHNEPTLGFSALDRGNALHQILANFWTQVQSSDNLQSLSKNAIAEIVDAIIADTLTEATTKAYRRIGHNHQQLEKDRLLSLILTWLEQEKSRPNFSVTTIERRLNIELNNFQLNVQVDRIDTLEDGKYFIIDYKTGSASTNDWKSGQLFDPQLPLYACTVSPEDTTGIAFATINSAKQKLVGWGDNLSIAGITPQEQQTWQQQIDTWQVELFTLTSEIRRGYAPVHYRSINAQRFEENLKPLNRLDELKELEYWSNQRR